MLRVFIVASVIVAVCVLIHITGMVLLAEWLIDRRASLERHSALWRLALVLVMVFAITVVLHLTEAAIWAAFYWWWSLFPDYETSLYYSLTCYTTMGFGDVVLPEKWRLLGGIEGFSGVLLCGLSTAFIFVIVSALLEIRAKHSNES